MTTPAHEPTAGELGLVGDHDTGDLVGTDPDHEGEETDAPREEDPDPLDDLDDGDVVPAEELED